MFRPTISGHIFFQTVFLFFLPPPFPSPASPIFPPFSHIMEDWENPSLIKKKLLLYVPLPISGVLSIQMPISIPFSPVPLFSPFSHLSLSPCLPVFPCLPGMKHDLKQIADIPPDHCCFTDSHKKPILQINDKPILSALPAPHRPPPLPTKGSLERCRGGTGGSRGGGDKRFYVSKKANFFTNAKKKKKKFERDSNLTSISPPLPATCPSPFCQDS